MLFAGLAASAAIDLLSLLQPEKPKGGTAGEQTAFSVPESDFGAATAASPQTADRPGESLSIDTLLSAQEHHSKRSMSVLLGLLQSSQDSTVAKSDLEKASGDADAPELFDLVDQNHDATINNAELTSFLEAYRRTQEPSARKGTALALAA